MKKPEEFHGDLYDYVVATEKFREGFENSISITLVQHAPDDLMLKNIIDYVHENFKTLLGYEKDFSNDIIKDLFFDKEKYYRKRHRLCYYENTKVKETQNNYNTFGAVVPVCKNGNYDINTLVRGIPNFKGLRNLTSDQLAVIAYQAVYTQKSREWKLENEGMLT